MLQIVLAGGGVGSNGHGPPLGLTSPPDWVPYCSGCPVAERTKMSRRCPKSFRESLIQRKTPVVEKPVDPGHSAKRIHSVLSMEAGRSEPPPGSPAQCSHAE